MEMEGRSDITVLQFQENEITENNSFKNKNSIKLFLRAGKMTQWLRAFAVLPDDQDLVSSTHIKDHNLL